MNNDAIPTLRQIAAECICLNTQRAARTVARRYDAAFRPIGLTSGQFSILAGLNQQQPVALGVLAGALGLERTTLTRNLAPLEAGGLIRSQAGEDRRARGILLTAAGQEKLRIAVPLWRSAQEAAQQALQSTPWSDAQRALAMLAAD